MNEQEISVTDIIIDLNPINSLGILIAALCITRRLEIYDVFRYDTNSY